jgi:hypothetical protein
MRFGLALLSFGLFAALPAPGASTPKAMRDAFDALSNIQAVLNAEGGVKIGDVRFFLKRDFARLAALKHSLPKDMVDKDPAVAIALQSYMAQVADAKEELLNVHLDEARLLVQGMTATCFACHTSTAPVAYEDIRKRARHFKSDDWQKAEYLSSTRQTKEAMEMYRLLFDKNVNIAADPFRRARALKRVLTILVRIDGDPKATVTELEKLASDKSNLDPTERELATAWLEDAKYWRDSDHVSVEDLSGSGLMKVARRLYDRSVSLRRASDSGNGELSALRATALMHEALRRGLSGEERGEGLLLLGLSYREITDPAFARLDGAFLEACIRENAGRPVARKCYDAYYRDISRSLFAPRGRRDVSDELRKLAEPKTKP